MFGREERAGATTLLSCLLASAGAGVGQSLPATAKGITEPGRSLRRPLDMFLATAPDSKTSARSLLVVLDPSPAVAEAGFGREFRAALASCGDLREARLGLFVVGAPKARVAPVAGEAERVGALIVAQLARPNEEPQNVFAALREAVPLLARCEAPRRLLLVTLDNGEAEDAVEETAKLLKRHQIQLDVITREACFADSQGAACGNPMTGEARVPPRNALWVGGDAPWIDLPYGFLFQPYDTNSITPAGYAPWALARLVYGGGGGRVFLHAGATTYGHHCILRGECPTCGVHFYWPDTRGKHHENHTEAYLPGRLEAMAPLVVSRTEAAECLTKDPYARAVHVAWQRAHEAGLVAGQPPLTLQENRLVPEKSEPDWERFAEFDLLGGFRPNDVPRIGKRARELAAAAAEIEVGLAKVLATNPDGDPRQRAIAHATQAMLLLTRVSLLSLERYCRQDAAEALRQLAAAGEKGEPSLTCDEQSICHGMASYLRRETEEGPVRAEMARLARLLDAFEQSFGGSPVSFAVRRLSFPKFRIWLYDADAEKKAPRPQSEERRGPETPPRRPARPASAPASGPTTGGR